MPGTPVPLIALAVGAAAVALGVLLVRLSGASVRTGRRLAGAPSWSLADLVDAAAQDRLPSAAVRVGGRVRCVNPIVTVDGDRLAALHRDVEVRLPDGHWRVIERIRESRPIDLWERASSVALDLSALAEPLITIPHVWHGAPGEVEAAYGQAIARLAADGTPPDAARSTTRQLSLVDQVLALVETRRDDRGRLSLRPPPGGFVVSAVDLDTAMRLLAGPHRARMMAGFGIGLVGALLIGVAAVSLLINPSP